MIHFEEKQDSLKILIPDWYDDSFKNGFIYGTLYLIFINSINSDANRCNNALSNIFYTIWVTKMKHIKS